MTSPPNLPLHASHRAPFTARRRAALRAALSLLLAGGGGPGRAAFAAPDDDRANAPPAPAPAHDPASAAPRAPAAGSAYPVRPVRIVLPFPPGGTSDTLIRLIAPKLQQALGQPVVIDNRGGASGTIGADLVAKSPPDGHTLLVGSTHHTIAQAVLPKLPYDFGRDLAPVSMLAIVPNVVVVNASVPAHTVSELVALSKADPERLAYASAGAGSAHHLIGESFRLRTGARLTHVPYKGSGPAVADLLGGHVSVMFDTVTSALPNVRAGRTRALAVTTGRRSSVLPDVPTLAEAGVDGIDIGTWFALFVPAGTPPAIIERLDRETVAILHDPDVRRQLLEQGIEPAAGTPAQLGRRVEAELRDFAALVAQTGLRAS